MTKDYVGLTRIKNTFIYNAFLITPEVHTTENRNKVKEVTLSKKEMHGALSLQSTPPLKLKQCMNKVKMSSSQIRMNM